MFYLETIGCKQGRETHNHIDQRRGMRSLVVALSTEAALPRAMEALERLGGQFAPFVLWPEGVRARRADAVWAPS